MLWEINKNDSGVGLTYTSGSTEHDSFISALSVNSTSQQAVTASEDYRLRLVSTLHYSLKVVILSLMAYHTAIALKLML